MAIFGILGSLLVIFGHFWPPFFFRINFRHFGQLSATFSRLTSLAYRHQFQSFGAFLGGLIPINYIKSFPETCKYKKRSPSYSHDYLTNITYKKVACDRGAGHWKSQLLDGGDDNSRRRPKQQRASPAADRPAPCGSACWGPPGTASCPAGSHRRRPSRPTPCPTLLSIPALLHPCNPQGQAVGLEERNAQQAEKGRKRNKRNNFNFRQFFPVRSLTDWLQSSQIEAKKMASGGVHYSPDPLLRFPGACPGPCFCRTHTVPGVWVTPCLPFPPPFGSCWWGAPGGHGTRHVDAEGQPVGEALLRQLGRHHCGMHQLPLRLGAQRKGGGGKAGRGWGSGGWREGGACPVVGGEGGGLSWEVALQRSQRHQS